MRIVFKLLFVCSIFFLSPNNVFAERIELNEIMGAERFISKYNDFCAQNDFQQAVITFSKEGNVSGERVFKFFYGYAPGGGDGLGWIYTNDAGYISSIRLFLRPGMMTSSQAMMATLAVVDGRGYPPVQAVSDAFNYDSAKYYSGSTNRYYFIYRDGAMEQYLHEYPQYRDVRVYHITAHDKW